MRKYKFTPFVVTSMIIMGISLFLPFLPWLSNKNGSYSIMFIGTYNHKFDIGLGLSVLFVFLLWLSQASGIPSLILYFIRKQYAPIILPLISSALMLISSLGVIVTQTPHVTIIPFVSALLAIANLILAVAIKKKR